MEQNPYQSPLYEQRRPPAQNWLTWKSLTALGALVALMSNQMRFVILNEGGEIAHTDSFVNAVLIGSYILLPLGVIAFIVGVVGWVATRSH